MLSGRQASQNTTDPGAMQKSEEFLSAFMMGFELADAIALLRVDDLYVGMQILHFGCNRLDQNCQQYPYVLHLK